MIHNPDAVQTCWRWLVPIDARWMAAATGTRMHYAPAARENRIYRFARCGTGVSVTRDQLLRNDGRWDKLFPCARCVDSVAREAATTIDLRELKEIVRQMRRNLAQAQYLRRKAMAGR